jgi:hypothetical protein
MDDIYFGVLRLWHLLTSSKKVIVAVVGVVAVVATVTTVFAAPTEETEGVVASGATPQQATPVVSSDVATPSDVITIGDVSSPGILPSSPFYPLKTVMREVSLVFTFDSLSKAQRCLRYANEDLLAICALYDNNEVLASGQCTDYTSNFWNSILWIAKAGREGRDVQAAMTNLRSSHDSHRLALADVLVTVEDANAAAGGLAIANGGVMRDSVIEAAASTSAELEFAILALQGQPEAVKFHTKLQSDFSLADREVWLQIENRLGMPADQAIALTTAIGPEGAGAVTGMPIISSVKVDHFRVEPGQSCVLTCNATDFEGDPITYQWLCANGELEGDGSIVTWHAPEGIGEYRINVVVSDPGGNQSSKAVTIVVGNPTEEDEEASSSGPFGIDAMEVVPDGHDLLKPPALGLEYWTILVGRGVEITCVIDGDTDGLEFDWDCDVGDIDGSGETVLWEAPGHACYAQVTVHVRGADGEREEESVTFRVSTCAKCFG